MRSGLSHARSEGAVAEDLGPLHAVDRRQPRLDHPQQVIRDLVLLEDRRAERQVHRRDAAVRRLDRDRRDLGLGRQVGADLVDAGADVRERVAGVEVELEPDVDRRQALDALRLDEVDAVRGRDRSLERRGDEAADQLGVGADVRGAHRDRRALELGVLSDVERADRLQPRDHDHEVDDDGEHRSPDEEVGEAHGSPL
jgi:hypothetical protein